VILRLLSYNIRFGGVGRERLLAAVINACEPDLVVLEEATHPGVVKRLAQDCGMRQHGSRLGYSLAWMSRVDNVAGVWHKPWLARRSYLELDAGGLRIYGVHLAAIHSNLMEQRRVWELRRILANMPAGPHVLTGDFNSLAPGEVLDLARLPNRLRAIAWATGGRVRWRTIQLMLKAGYLDSYRALHPADELHRSDPGYTFPAWDPHLRLDYCFARELPASCDVMSEIAGAIDYPTREASDHLPLLTVLKP
jgi:endonuclease/exonuclease/phosphatase family metal-dependent hydrolase